MRPELASIPDEALARQAQAGDASCFEELVHRHEARMFHFLLRCAQHEADARDLTQETFVSAYLKIGQFDPARSFLTWLFTIARHKWIDRCRVTRPPTPEPPPEQADLDDPATLLIRGEEGRNLWAVARRVLPELQFQALWLKYAEDLSVRDVARVLRRTQTHVKVLLFRARIALGRELDAACGAQQPGPVEQPATAASPARVVAASSRTAPVRVNLGFNLRT